MNNAILLPLLEAQFQVVSPPTIAVIINVSTRDPETLVAQEELAATELLDADPIVLLQSTKSPAQVLMSPNEEVLVAKLEHLLVFATAPEAADPSKSILSPYPPNFPRS